MRIRIVPLGLTVIAFFAAGIAGTMVFNIWRTESSKAPSLIESGEFAGLADPADIRGSYTLEDLRAAFSVPVETLATAFGVSGTLDEAKAFQVKEFESLYGGSSEGFEIGTDSVRWFVALYAGLPFEPGEGTGMPESAIGVLEARGLSPDVLPLLRARGVGMVVAAAVDAPEAAAARAAEPKVAEPKVAEPKTETPSAAESKTDAPKAAETATKAPKPAEGSTADRSIKGTTTFGDLEAWGLSRQSIAEAMGMEIGPSNAAIRTWLAEKGLEFSAYKAKLQALADAAP